MMHKADGLLTDADALLGREQDMSQEIEQVVARIAEASLASKALSEAIIGIREEAAQTEQRAKAALEETQAASMQMHTLDSVADEIAGVVALIGSVASETKMLALNAAIEAARAGPAGAGFAVVANEVRLLAQRSAQEARMVQERIASIVSTTAAARASITAIDMSAQEVHRLSASIARRGRLAGGCVDPHVVQRVGDFRQRHQRGARPGGHRQHDPGGRGEPARDRRPRPASCRRTAPT